MGRRRTLRRTGHRKGQEATTSRSGRLELWLEVNSLAVVAALLVAAIAVRVEYFRELQASPFAAMHTWRQSDMQYYDAWARSIAAGDWLSRGVSVPMHGWHHEVAQYYLASHTDIRPELEHEATRSGKEVDEVLWRQWLHTPRFYQDPLYPYLIALTYMFTGADARYALAWQAGLGVITIFLVWSLSRRYFGALVATVAGVLAVGYQPFVFYEFLLLRDSTLVFSSFALLWLAERAFRQDSRPSYLVLGLALGLSFLLKSTFVIFAVGIAVGVVARSRSTTRKLLVCAIIPMLVGIVVGVSPLVARNVAVGVSPAAVASSGPFTFVASNEPRYSPDVGFGINTPVLASFLGDTNGGWGSAIGGALRRHDAASYTALVWRKWDRLWHWFEIPNNENVYYLARQLPILRTLPLTFGLVAPIALIGIGVSWPQRRETWALILLVASTGAHMMVFYVLARFRLPLAGAILPFAAVAIVQVSRWLLGGHVIRAFAAISCTLLVAAWTGRPLAADQRLIRMSDWILAYTVYYQPKITDAVDAKDWMRAGVLYDEFFRRFEPSDEEIRASNDPTLARELAEMHTECAQLLAMSGDTALAAAHRRRVEQVQSIVGPR